MSFRNDIYQMDGSGFTVGQPMPVGEMSPDGKRFVLKPLPRALPIDAAEADGAGFFGTHSGQAAQTSSLFAPSATTKKTEQLALATSHKGGGLFDWNAYYKKKAAADKVVLKLGKTKTKIALKKGANVKVAAKLDAKPIKKIAKKKLDCKVGADGSSSGDCKPAVIVAAKAADATKTP